MQVKEQHVIIALLIFIIALLLSNNTSNTRMVIPTQGTIFTTAMQDVGVIPEFDVRPGDSLFQRLVQGSGAQ
jgi:hypothetical protein